MSLSFLVRSFCDTNQHGLTPKDLSDTPTEAGGYDSDE